MKSLLESDVIVLNIAKHCKSIKDIQTLSILKPHLIFWHRGWHKNGQLWYETPLVNGEIHGVEKTWYMNGQLSSVCSYVNDGEKHGVEKGWYMNGELMLSTPYVNGKVDGVVKWWHENGRLASVSLYVNGDILRWSADLLGERLAAGDMSSSRKCTNELIGVR